MQDKRSGRYFELLSELRIRWTPQPRLDIRQTEHWRPGALSRRSSRCVGADWHPAAEKRTPSTQAKAACRLTGLEMAPMTVLAASERRTNSGILHRCLSWSVPRCLQLSTNRRMPLSQYRSWAWSLPTQGAPGLNDLSPRK